jgi:hypothetical protein
MTCLANIHSVLGMLWDLSVQHRLGCQPVSRFAVAFVLIGILSVCEIFSPGLLLATEPRHQSENFVVDSFAGGPSPERIAALCESLRIELGRAWCDAELKAWNPRCEIAVHATLAEYVQAVGHNGSQTLGSSLIQVNSGRTLSRRIDLLVDVAGDLPALPHELTHVVMSERFEGVQPPHWFDEGAAMLADTLHKQSLHERDCRDALRSGSAMPFAELLNLEQFTFANQMPAFYGQSASLTRFLCQKDDITRVTRFACDATKVGYRQALLTHYKIESVEELERQWRHYVYTDETPKLGNAALAINFTP